jgi:hypothetical protein
MTKNRKHTVKTVFFFEGKTQFQMIIKSFDCSRISVSVIMHFSYFYSTNYVCKVYVGRFVFLFSADYTYSTVLNSKRLNSYLQKTVSGGPTHFIFPTLYLL